MKTYSPKKVAVSFNGIPLTGFAKGSFIEATQDEDSFAKDMGSDGEAARTQNANEGGKVKLTLMQQSASNDTLSAQHKLDRRTGLGTGVLFIKDASGRTLVNLSEAWIMKPSDVTLADGAQGREWTFDTGKIDMDVGGN